MPSDVDVLVARYASLIRSAVARVAGPRASEIGDDVVQRVTTALWQRVGREPPIDHPASYLYRCAIREAVRELDRLGDVTEPLADDVADPAFDPETRLRARQLGEAIERCLERLPGERAAAVRAHLAGFAVDEIMEVHGWGYQKARNLITRGMADLRERLIEQGHGDS